MAASTEVGGAKPPFPVLREVLGENLLSVSRTYGYIEMRSRRFPEVIYRVNRVGAMMLVNGETLANLNVSPPYLAESPNSCITAIALHLWFDEERVSRISCENQGYVSRYRAARERNGIP